jgi:hypothetical protein
MVESKRTSFARLDCNHKMITVIEKGREALARRAEISFSRDCLSPEKAKSLLDVLHAEVYESGSGT